MFRLVRAANSHRQLCLVLAVIAGYDKRHRLAGLVV
jgi:hypothetical protein